MSHPYASGPAEPALDETPFVGREPEMAELADLLGRARLVTVMGPGGVGKTRLSVRAVSAAAPRFADGACVIPLSAVSDPELLPHAVVSRLGLSGQGTRTATETVLDYLRDREMLLVLDTCEHLIDACADLVETLLEEAGRVTVLATSRQPLDVNGENVFPLSPLRVPAADGVLSPGDATDLFVRRAVAAAGPFAVTTDNRRDVIGVCERLDGIPLAIELAAVRLRTLPLAELARLLDSRLALAERRHPAAGQLPAVPGREAAPGDRLAEVADDSRAEARHRTLKAAIGWSYDLCAPAEQALWERLSVFAGSFGIDAAREVCAGRNLPPGSVAPALVSLVDKSVLVREEPDDDGSRYRFLDTIREFGAERLAASGAEAGVRDRLIAYYQAKARYFEEHFVDDDQAERLREFDREHANLQAALEYALESEQARRLRDGAALASDLCGHWAASGRLREGGYWLAKVAERFPGATPERARALVVWSYLNAFAGETDKAVADGQEGIRIAGELGDERLRARGHVYLHLALSVAGKLAEADECAAEGYRLLEAAGDRIGLLTLDVQVAHMHQLSGNLDLAAEASRNCLRRFGRSEEQWLHSFLHVILAFSLFQVAGEEKRCAEAASRALSAKHELGDLVSIAYTLEVFAGLAARTGRHGRSAWLMGAAEPLWARTGQRLASIPALEQLHQLSVKTGREELGEHRFDTLYTRGSRYPRGGIVSLAITDADDLPPVAPAAL